jgi:nicotinamide-nucleotide amidase
VRDAAVCAMAGGALGRTGANVAMAVSGIAGPTGAVPGKPVGTVWFALAQKLTDRLECEGHLIQFDGDRDAVRRQSVEYALNLLRALPPRAD